MTNKYYPSIGIECHVQLKTATKLFAGVSNDARGAEPNTLVSHICFGMPGALPVLNEKVVEYACRVAFAFNTKPQKYSVFERKHYFYPDLPKGYQITQLSRPIVVGGSVKIVSDQVEKKIRIHRIQIEEDAGKNTHPDNKDYSLVDLNRAGTPLLEIVSEPDMHTPAEAKAYAKELYLIMRYTDVSDADMFHGNMRFDVNVSLSPDKNKLGTRSETKNLNSFRSVEKAVEFEIKRQAEVLNKGGKIVQETRGWDDTKQKTVSQRGKEEAHDYRYFPDPDLPPVVLEEKFVSEIKTAMPVLPEQWRQRLVSLGLDKRHVDMLLEAEVEGPNSYLTVLEKHIKTPGLAKFLANWFVNSEISMRRDEAAESSKRSQDFEAVYLAVFDMLATNKLSSTSARALLTELIKLGTVPDNLEKYASEQGYIQVSDTKEIETIVKKVIAAHPEAANDVFGGEAKAIGFLVGQVMKESLGKANPKLAQDLIKKELS